MLKSDIDAAKTATKYLEDTDGYDSNQVTSFVVSARQPGMEGRNATTIVIDNQSPSFPTLLNAFTNKVNAQRTAAQNLLTSLGVT